MRKLMFGVATSFAVLSSAAMAAPPSLTPIGSVKTGPFRDADPRVAEINAYDPAGKRIYVVNPQQGLLDVIDASVANAPVQLAAESINLAADCLAELGAGCGVLPSYEPNSLAIRGDLLAVAVAANPVRTDNGYLVLYRLQGTEPPELLTAIEVGAGPDMVTFAADGKYILVANEGEPDSTYTIDPPGTVSIIEPGRIDQAQAVRHVGFERFDVEGQRAKLERDGVRIFGPGASVAQDLEPEYITTKGNKAYVTLQENNAVAVINIAGATVEKITGLGRKDHSRAGNALEASDQNASGAINIRNWPVSGMFMPDGIAAFNVGGRTYLICANEGDARAYAGYSEESRVGSSSYILDPLVFPNAADLKQATNLGRLNVTTATGDVDGDGDFDRIDVFGARSVSILDQQGRMLWDSGEMLERVAERYDIIRDPANGRTLFNTTNSANSRKNRSDDKSVEPESVVVGDVGGHQYAFVALERDSGIVVLELADPVAPEFVTYANNRKFPRNAATGAFLACSSNDCGDLGPEGLTFVPAAQSPNGKALLIVSNEVSSTTTIWQVE